MSLAEFKSMFRFDDPRTEIGRSASNEVKRTLGIPLIGEIPEGLRTEYLKLFNELMADSDFNPFTEKNQSHTIH